MNIGIAVFAYNRSSHLAKVLKALEQNKITQKMYFFQDGLKNSYDEEEWNKVHDLMEKYLNPPSEMGDRAKPWRCVEY